MAGQAASLAENAQLRFKKGDDMAKPEDTPKPTTEESPRTEKPSHCLLCGLAGPTLLYGHWICDHCKNVVQAEAVSQKRKIVKEGGGPLSR